MYLLRIFRRDLNNVSNCAQDISVWTQLLHLSATTEKQNIKRITISDVYLLKVMGLKRDSIMLLRFPHDFSRLSEMSTATVPDLPKYQSFQSKVRSRFELKHFSKKKLMSKWSGYAIHNNCLICCFRRNSWHSKETYLRILCVAHYKRTYCLSKRGGEGTVVYTSFL